MILPNFIIVIKKFQIRDIQKTDIGIYKCQGILENTSKNKTFAEVTLQLSGGLPSVIYDNSTKSIVVKEGQPVNLKCYANGFPKPIVSWRRPKNLTLPTGNSIYR